MLRHNPLHHLIEPRLLILQIKIILMVLKISFYLLLTLNFEGQVDLLVHPDVGHGQDEDIKLDFSLCHHGDFIEFDLGDAFLGGYQFLEVADVFVDPADHD